MGDVTGTQPSAERTVRDHWWWRPGWRLGRRAYTFHITFEDAVVDGAEELRRLVRSYQRRLEGVGSLDMVPLRWLHLTMQNVGFTDEVSDSDCRAVAAAAREMCARLAPFLLTFNEVEVRAEAIAFRPSPAEPVAALRDTVRSAIASVRGAIPEAPEHAHGFQPHVSLAYVNAPGPAAPLVEAVSSVEEAPVSVLVGAASLIVLDRDERVYRWSRYETISLGSAAAPTA
jgi:2'-5' RNA ligase